LWTKKVKVYFDKSINGGTAKNILIRNLHNEQGISKCNLRIPHVQLKIYPYENCTVNQKNQSANHQFHLGCMPKSSHKTFNTRASS